MLAYRELVGLRNVCVVFVAILIPLSVRWVHAQAASSDSQTLANIPLIAGTFTLSELKSSADLFATFDSSESFTCTSDVVSNPSRVVLQCDHKILKSESPIKLTGSSVASRLRFANERNTSRIVIDISGAAPSVSSAGKRNSFRISRSGVPVTSSPVPTPGPTIAAGGTSTATVIPTVTTAVTPLRNPANTPTTSAAISSTVPATPASSPRPVEPSLPPTPALSPQAATPGVSPTVAITPTAIFTTSPFEARATAKAAGTLSFYTPGPAFSPVGPSIAAHGETDLTSISYVLLGEKKRPTIAIGLRAARKSTLIQDSATRYRLSIPATRLLSPIFAHAQPAPDGFSPFLRAVPSELKAAPEPLAVVIQIELMEARKLVVTQDGNSISIGVD